MVSELSFATYSVVSDSWERVRRVKEYHTVLGTLIFTKFFSIQPEAVSVFSIKGDVAECVKSGAFLSHAKKFVEMFDSAVDMLGPNIEILTEILTELGQKHVKYGVKLEYYPAMGIALIDAVRRIDKQFTKATEIAWREVYNSISLDMSKAA